MIKYIIYGVVLYYAVINLVLFIMMAVDKQKAKKGHWRISETTLLVMGLMGGAIGAILGMKAFHHKTQKVYFYMVYICAVIIHVFAIYFISTL